MCYFIYITIPLICGFILDLLLGEPVHMKHPVVLIGRLISYCEKAFLDKADKADKGLRMAAGSVSADGTCEGGQTARSCQKRTGGVITVMIVCLVTAAASVIIPSAAFALGGAAGRLLSASGLLPLSIFGMPCWLMTGRFAAAAVLSVMCWLMIAARSLREESMKVYAALEEGNTEKARSMLSMIVGRDTSVLDRDGITRAAVETVAENTSDGVTAPVFFMAVAGIPGMYVYKAVNTMDSMIGYKNDRYIDFGRCAARLDDVLNYIPSRLTALIMIAAAGLLRDASGRNARRIWLRDRRKHASPNSAQTESVCAGALGLRLAGPAVYFGKLHDKPFIGDAVRGIEAADIVKANKLMYASAFIMTAAAAAAGVIVLMFSI